MNGKALLARLTGRSGLLALLTLATGGLFKLAAFARETFIASHFGLSNVTDAYFAFQQFPLMLATFMFGAFTLAFTPAYAAEKRIGPVRWLSGLVFYGCAGGVLLTFLTIVFAPWLLTLFTSSPSAHGSATLIILSCAFAPVIALGIWAALTIGNGHNVKAMFVAGLPYLIMTVLLVGLFAIGRLDDLSLPFSFLVGFGSIGIFALLNVVLRECSAPDLRSILSSWRMPGFRRFLQALAASSFENLGYSANQLLIVFFLAKAGPGTVSANTCAMRVGLLGFSLCAQPFAQLLQAKLCSARESEMAEVFKKWFLAIGGAVIVFAALLYIERTPVTSIVYLRGKFSLPELSRVIEIMPAWIAYFVVISLNTIVARYLFARSVGSTYARRQLVAYLAANLIRFALWGRLSAPLVIWCSVFTEGCALLMSLRACFRTEGSALIVTELVEAQEV